MPVPGSHFCPHPLSSASLDCHLVSFYSCCSLSKGYTNKSNYSVAFQVPAWTRSISGVHLYPIYFMNIIIFNQLITLYYYLFCITLIFTWHYILHLFILQAFLSFQADFILCLCVVSECMYSWVWKSESDVKCLFLLLSFLFLETLTEPRVPWMPKWPAPL